MAIQNEKVEKIMALIDAGEPVTIVGYKTFFSAKLNDDGTYSYENESNYGSSGSRVGRETILSIVEIHAAHVDAEDLGITVSAERIDG